MNKEARKCLLAKITRDCLVLGRSLGYKGKTLDEMKVENDRAMAKTKRRKKNRNPWPKSSFVKLTKRQIERAGLKAGKALPRI
jgi:hypothetical protein